MLVIRCAVVSMVVRGRLVFVGVTMMEMVIMMEMLVEGHGDRRQTGCRPQQ